MAKKRKRARKLTTNEAIELLLGQKAARRLRKVAIAYAAAKTTPKKIKKKSKKKSKKNRDEQPSRPLDE